MRKELAPGGRNSAAYSTSLQSLSPEMEWQIATWVSLYEARTSTYLDLFHNVLGNKKRLPVDRSIEFTIRQICHDRLFCSQIFGFPC